MTQSGNDFTGLIREAREQIENKEYSAAIANLDYIIENNARDGDAFYFRGKAYAQLKKYKPALVDYETALDIYRETDNKKYQIYTLFELTFVYTFNGKTTEGHLAHLESIKIAKELNLPEDDPLYSFCSRTPQMSDESLDTMESTLQDMESIPNWDKFGVMGKLMGYANRGKLQSYVVDFVLVLFAISAFAMAILLSPFWFPKMIYQFWQAKNSNNERE